MKTLLLFRLSLLALLWVLSAPSAHAQKVVYTEAPLIAKSGYWMLEVDQSQRNYTLVGFYNDQHELMYEERLPGLCLYPCQNPAARRRLSRVLGTALQQAQQQHARALIATKLIALNRQTQRAYAAW